MLRIVYVGPPLLKPYKPNPIPIQVLPARAAGHGQMAYGQMAYGQMAYGQMAYGQMVYALPPSRLGLG